MDKNLLQYLPTFAELLDRMSIVQLKIWLIPDKRSEFEAEMKALLNDVQVIIDSEKPVITADMLRAIIVMAQTNLNIWKNEGNYRKGIDSGNDLELTHSLNGLRNTAKNRIQASLGGRQDHKIDTLNVKHTQWEVGW